MMATNLETTAIFPLNRINYLSWKVQCQMALVCDGLWGIVNGTEAKERLTAAQSF